MRIKYIYMLRLNMFTCAHNVRTKIRCEHQKWSIMAWLIFAMITEHFTLISAGETVYGVLCTNRRPSNANIIIIVQNQIGALQVRCAAHMWLECADDILC